MITLHHLEKSRSHRVMWMLEELELPYEIVRYARDRKTMLAPPELRKVHPLGKSPVLVDDDGVVHAESGAILEHLVERYGGGRFVPAPGTIEHRRCRYFMHFAEGSLMPPLVLKLVTSRIRSAPLPFFVKPIARRIADKVDGQFTDPNLARHLEFLERELADREWFAGDAFTVADVQMGFPVTGLVRAASGPMTRLRSFVDRIHARPAYRKAVERGGEPL
jgi:glutathione S-transferase